MRPAPSLPVRPLAAALCLLLISSLTGCHWMSAQTSNQVGQAYYAFGNYTSAADEFRRAAIDDPQNADYYHNLAAARKKQGRIAAAERSYRQAIHVNPGHQPSWHGLATLLKEQNRNAEAIAMLQIWVGSEPYRTAPYVELAWIQRESGISPAHGKRWRRRNKSSRTIRRCWLTSARFIRIRDSVQRAGDVPAVVVQQLVSAGSAFPDCRVAGTPSGPGDPLCLRNAV